MKLEDKKLLSLFEIANNRINNQINELYLVNSIFLVINVGFFTLFTALYNNNTNIILIISIIFAIIICIIWLRCLDSQIRYKELWIKRAKVIDRKLKLKEIDINFWNESKEEKTRRRKITGVLSNNLNKIPWVFMFFYLFLTIYKIYLYDFSNIIKLINCDKLINWLSNAQIIGLFLSIVGAYYISRSFLFKNNDNLAAIAYGEEYPKDGLVDADLSENLFISFYKQSKEVNYGFIVITLGFIYQIIYIINPNLLEIPIINTLLAILSIIIPVFLFKFYLFRSQHVKKVLSDAQERNSN